MDNMGETEKDSLEMRKEYNRHALRIALFFVGLILSIVIFGVCGTNPRWPIEVFNKISRFVKPYSTLQFEKINSSRPNLHLVTAKSQEDSYKFQSFSIAYDNKNIQVYDSLSLTNLLTTHQVDGEIEYVDYFEGQSINIACQYLSGSKRFLDVYSIDKDWNWDSEKNQIIPNAKPTLDKVLSIKFDDMKFVCLAGENSFFAANNKTNTIEYFDGKSQVPGMVFPIEKPFIFDFDYSIHGIDIYAFDGKSIYHIEKSDKVTLVAKGAVKESTGLKNSYFIPVTTEHYNLYNTNGIILINDGKYFVFDSYNGSVSYKQLLLGDNSLKFYNIAQNHDNYYHFDEKQETLTPIKIKPINLFCMCWFPNVDQKVYSNDAVSSGIFVNLGLDQLDNDKPIIMFDYINNLYVCKTYGIDEPVTESYVSYENGFMSIYFMNDKSIYRCSLDQERMYNLKLRKLDLKPEPIKTSGK
ncbi:MAG: hypothetical protein KA140_07805 [Caldisericia bacterium]|nr:hypothetical protein [Caldisericia bacterium]